jgi:hypothetical protein
MWWPAVVKSEWELQFPLRLDYGRSPLAYVNQRLQIQLEFLMMNGVPLETYWAFIERWHNKFYCDVAFCWLFLLKSRWLAIPMKSQIIGVPLYLERRQLPPLHLLFQQIYFLNTTVFYSICLHHHATSNKNVCWIKKSQLATGYWNRVQYWVLAT